MNKFTAEMARNLMTSSSKDQELVSECIDTINAHVREAAECGRNEVSILSPYHLLHLSNSSKSMLKMFSNKLLMESVLNQMKEAGFVTKDSGAGLITISWGTPSHVPLKQFVDY